MADHNDNLTRNDTNGSEKIKTSKGSLLARIKNYFYDEEFAQLMDECQLNEETQETLLKFKNLE